MQSETRTCRDCGKEFESRIIRGFWLSRCPECADVRQHRPSAVKERTVVVEPIMCAIESLPGDWQQFVTGQHDDHPCVRMTVKGDRYGVAWNGRIDIYAHTTWQPGDVVWLTELEVVHRVKAVEKRCSTSPFTQLAGGPVAKIVHEKVPLWYRREGEEVIETRRYVRLDNVRDEEIANLSDAEHATMPRLVWREAHSKTTIKGFGRQYANQLRGVPLWEKRVSGGCRTGRIHSEGSLALVDDDHPLEVVNLFDN